MSEPAKKSFLDETIEHNVGHPATPANRAFAWALIILVAALVVLAVAIPITR